MGFYIDKVFGYPELVRFSWQTTTRMLEENAAPVTWYVCSCYNACVLVTYGCSMYTMRESHNAMSDDITCWRVTCESVHAVLSFSVPAMSLKTPCTHVAVVSCKGLFHLDFDASP